MTVAIIAKKGALAYQELIMRNIDGKPVRIIKVVLDGEHFLVTSLANTGGDTIENLTKKVGGKTSLNGVFFCPEDYSYCNGETFSNFERIYQGDALSYSKYRPDTGVRGIFGFTKDGKPVLVNNNLGYMTGLNLDINRGYIHEFYYGLGNFPILLAHGQDVLRATENDIDNKMRASANKHFICSTKDNSTIYMGAVGGSTIYEMPDYLKRNFDCEFALNLDAGYSSAMIYDGDVLQRSGRRNIMDAFVVLTKEEYAGLNGHIPNAQTQKTGATPYTLTSEDQEYIKFVSSTCKSFIQKHGEDFKRKVISLFRKMLDSPKYQTAQQQSRIHNILIELYKVDEL